MKNFGENHPEVASTYSNMAIVCSDGGDGLDRALEYHKKSLSIRVNCLGENHPGVTDSYHNIADVYSDQGELINTY